MKAAILGAGVFGTSLASELHERGADVTLIDPQPPGSGTTARAAGIIGSGQWHPTSAALVRRSVELLDEWGDDSPFGIHRVGGVWLLPEAHVKEARHLAALQRDAGLAVDELTPAEAARLPRMEGARLDDVAFVLHHPRDGWMMPRLYTEVRAWELREAEVPFIQAHARLDPDVPTRLALPDGPTAFDAVVVAAGVHTRALLGTAGLDAPLAAYRTQATKLQGPRAASLPIIHDVPNGYYLRPAGHERMLAGNGTTTTPEDPDAWQPDADAGFAADLTRRILKRFPEAGPIREVNAWAGIDTATPDRLPLAGVHPDAPGVWMMVGGNGHGFMRAPALAESLAQCIMGEAPRVDLAAFAPARFSDMRAPFAIREGGPFG